MEEKKSIVQPQPLMKSFETDKSKKSLLSPKLIIGLIVIVLLGTGTGYFFYQRSTTSSPKAAPGATTSSSASKGTTVGSNDTETFKDIVEGELKEGGIEGEGQFHLVRPGGDSQNVYMTSSIVDLSQFLNKKVKVWGQTQKAQSAGWLMDVGRLEVLK